MITYEGPIISIEPMAYVEFVPIARVTSQTSNGSVLRRTSANMPRVRWYVSHSVLCLLIGVCSFWIVTVDADCWYDDDRHEEGKEVPTAEPCLNCTCSRGSLLCYLRVCPKLPNPPPSGCILLHRYRTCCPELICTEFSGSENSLEGRSDGDDGLDMSFDRTILKNACIANGSIYGPGSAMHSSSLCEYCYCLGGKQICVKPKCLLPIDGCTPMYDPTNCCPVHYNCTPPTLPQFTTTTSTTTENPKELELKGSCLVDGVHYLEGGKVLGIGHSVCDNCYCMKSLVRCEPLSCAPPLLGCIPVIKPGECCAASYNCSGTIEIQPEPNYGLFPIVSKEYAKLRKEVNQKRPPNNQGNVTAAPFYVLAESLHPSTTKHRSPGTFGTTRHFTGVAFNPSTTKPFYYNSMKKEQGENKHSTMNHAESKESFPGIYYATTNYEFQNTNYKRVFSTTTRPKSTEPITFKTVNAITTTNYKDKKTVSSTTELIDDGRIYRRVDNETTPGDSATTGNSIALVTTTDLSGLDETTADSTSTAKWITDNLIGTETNFFEPSTEEGDVTTTENIITSAADSGSNQPHPVTLRTILNSTDCIKGKDNLLDLLESNRIEVTTFLPVDANEINKLAEVRRTVYEESLTTTDSGEDSTETTTEEDVTEVDLVSRVNVASATLRSIPDIPDVPNIQSDIEAILNITKHKSEDYEYDYNEPSLPPSLPNLRIIPFVAADALDPKKDISKESVVYPQERVTDTSFGYTNLFSPPIETEGGFVPKDPPILDNFYENAVTVPSITVPPKPNNDCINQEGLEIGHGQSVPSESACVTCTCFFGNVVCQKPTCPIPRSGCRKSSVQDLNLCCPHYVCDDEEAPTVVLDRLEGMSNPQEVVTVADKVVKPDPFRDVIRTEPAPNLQSLIVDMMPFFARKTTTPLSQIVTDKPLQTTLKNDEENVNKTDEGFSLDKVLQLLFSGDNEEKTETYTNKIQTTVIQPADRLSTVASTPSPSVTEKLNSTNSLTDNLDRPELNEPNSNSNSVDSPGVGSLKVAGCNIYGRMYRVGRIISELSGPCLECKCTEIGVHCEALKC